MSAFQSTNDHSNMASNSREEAIRKAKLGIAAFVDHVHTGNRKQMDLDIMERAEVVDASMAGTVTIDFKLDPRYINGGGFLHGAATSAIFDCYTCVAFSPLLPDWNVELHRTGPPGGVTRALNVSYLRAVPIKATIRVHAEVISNGRAATLARATMMSQDGKKIYATCEHHKIPTAVPGKASKAWTKASKL